MNIEINHTLQISASADFLSALNNLASALSGRTAPGTSQSEVLHINNPVKEAKPAATASDDFKVADTAKSTITVEQVRVAVKAKTDAGKREEVKGILKEFNAASVTALDTTQYPAFLEKVNAL